MVAVAEHRDVDAPPDGRMGERVVDQDPHDLGNALIIHTNRAPPHIGQPAQMLGNGIGALDIGVAENLDLLVIVCSQQRKHEERLAVAAEIGRAAINALVGGG